jgi:signal transduction histidine kinase
MMLFVTDVDDLRERARPALRQAREDLIYLATGLATSIVAMVVWIAGVTVTLSLAVFLIGIPVVLASATAFRWAADLDRANAARALGAPLSGRYDDHENARLLGRVSAVLHDRQTWRDLAWLVSHSIVGLAFGWVALSAIVNVAALLTLPAWFWALPDSSDYWGLLPVGQAWGALLGCVLAVPLAVLTVPLLRVMAEGEARMAAALLGPAGVAAQRAPGDDHSARAPRDPGLALGVHAGLAAVAILVTSAVWLLTASGGAFWPAWVAIGVALSSGIHDAIVRAVRAGPRRGMRLLATLEGCLFITGVCVAVWAMTGAGSPWPLWPVLGFTVILSVQALVLYRDRLPWARERELVERVDELTRTRRGALDVQASELRRIERDLHDGAQARLVALSMLMGRAEERLADQPEIAELVRRAREEAGAAIGELRDLARGIAPPILVDRGLVAAVESLAQRVPIAVAVDGPPALDRPAPVVETAAYFVVAESLTNATKYGRGAPARVTVGEDDEVLVVEIVDEGPGGADAAGSGLTGLRHRVEALDGTLRVEPGPDGRGTLVRAELPIR